jgi:hypothetical protein
MTGGNLLFAADRLAGLPGRPARAGLRLEAALDEGAFGRGRFQFERLAVDGPGLLQPAKPPQ